MEKAVQVLDEYVEGGKIPSLGLYIVSGHFLNQPLNFDLAGF